MQAFDVQFPDTTPWLRAVLEPALTASTDPATFDVWVASKLPAPLRPRMVILTNNSGPDDGPQKIERYGVNVWAPGAQSLALARFCAATLRASADGRPVTRLQVTGGPYDVADEDDDATQVDGATLGHHFFTLELTVRGVNL